MLKIIIGNGKALCKVIKRKMIDLLSLGNCIKNRFEKFLRSLNIGKDNLIMI